VRSWSRGGVGVAGCGGRFTSWVLLALGWDGGGSGGALETWLDRHALAHAADDCWPGVRGDRKWGVLRSRGHRDATCASLALHCGAPSPQPATDSARARFPRQAGWPAL
jgi:hypothetical protein